MSYFFHMEKPGWGVLVVIVAGLVVLAVFLIFPNQELKDSAGLDESETGTPMLVDKKANDMARDTMNVVDGTESTAEIVRGAAEPMAATKYDPAGALVTNDSNVKLREESADNNLGGYLNSLESNPPRSLFELIDSENFAAVHNMVDSGEDVHQRDQEENTVMHHAAAIQGAVEIGSFFIRYGADVNAINGAGRTPLDVARSASNLEFEQLLLAYGARSGNVSDVRPVSVLE
tara:strand:- start:1974 stop:2669 length:696 start_codon:yes stop_codon:yes gene_type:complete